MLNERDFEAYSKELLRDLRTLDRPDLNTVAEWAKKKATAKAGAPWERHFTRQAMENPLCIEEIAKDYNVPVTLVRRIFIAGPGVCPGNWYGNNQGRWPLWGSTMRGAWRKVLSEIDESKLPPDGPIKRPLGTAAFGPHEDWTNDGQRLG